MNQEFPLPLFQLVTCISGAIDVISPEVANHHMRVASVASAIAEEMRLAADVRNDLLLAGALHDIGGFSSAERVDLMQFEQRSPHRHARVGQALLKTFPPFSRMARFVGYHHVPWEAGAGREFRGEAVPLESHLLHLADRVAVLIRPGDPILSQAERIRKRIGALTPQQFVPEIGEAFSTISNRDCFWMDAASSMVGELLRRRARLPELTLDLAGLRDLANLFRRLIDFRSRFTARHSSGVAAAAVVLAERAGFAGDDLGLMEIAGFLHDMGKLAIPREILEKPAKLDALEYDVMRSHAWHTYRILESLPALDGIRTWAALHQECLDGSGYPLGLKGEEISLGTRVMAVADVFTALAETRPYRAGLAAPEVLTILKGMVERGKLDGDLVGLLEKDFDEINNRRDLAQKRSEAEYDAFVSEIGPAS